MTRVKICGLTTLGDALAAVNAGADALGFVLADSPRRVDGQTARDIVRRLPPFVTTVGVFVDTPPAEVEALLDMTGIQVAQLHGREPPEACAIGAYPVIKRFRTDHHDTAVDLMERFARYEVAGYLLDPGAGSGRTFSWSPGATGGLSTSAFGRGRSSTGGQATSGTRGPGVGRKAALIVAGGLTAENVSQAIEAMHPYGVDVCSGVESAPGVKDAGKMRDFIQRVRETNAIGTTG